MPESTDTNSVDFATVASTNTDETATSDKISDKAIIYAHQLTDKQTFKNWSETFVDSLSGQQIYDAISVNLKPGNNKVKVPITRIPKDFLVDKAKLSEVQLHTRYYKVGWDIFHKNRPAENDGPADTPRVSIQEFEKMFYNLRRMIGDIGKSRIQAIFVNKFNTFFPDYTFSNGRKVTCVDDLCEAIVIEPYDDKAREMIHITLNVMWGGNTWAVILEAMIMEIFGLEYTDEFIDPCKKSGKDVVVQRNHLGGYIAALLVSRKNRICNQAIVRKLRTVHKEGLYARNVGISKNIAKFIRAERYDGWIGLCWDHPKIRAEGLVPTGQAKPTPPKDISQWLETMLAGGVNSVEGLIQAAKEPKQVEYPLPVFPTEEAAGLGQCVSPLSSDNSTLATSSTVSQLTTGTHRTPKHKEPQVQVATPVTKTPPVKKTTKGRGKTTVNKKRAAATPATSKTPAAKKPRKSIEIPTSPAKRGGPPPKKGAPKFVVRASPAKNLRSSPPKPATSMICEVDHQCEDKWIEWHASYWTPSYQETHKGAPMYCTGFCDREEDGSIVPKLITSDADTYDANPLQCKKVSDSRCGVVCPNSQKVDHKCMWALCDDCKLVYQRLAIGVLMLDENGVPIKAQKAQGKNPTSSKQKVRSPSKRVRKPKGGRR